MATRSTTVRALVIVAVWGFFWAKALGLTKFADPTAVDWMMDGDWLAHFFGWLFARSAPWAIPFGQAPDLVAPTGTSAALTDSIPLLTVLGKLVSPFFGDRLQLFGLWMVSGVIGTGVAGVLVCRAWLKDTASLALAGCLFVMNPIVSTRYGHPPFLGFWVLTGLVGACVWPVASLSSARRTALVTLGLGFVACGVHAYLAVMASVLVGASLVRLALVAKQFRVGEAIAWLVSGPAVCVFALWLFGFVSGVRSTPTGSLTVEGFGQFSADLLTLVNPTTWSRLLGPIAMGGRQYEGYAYLGLGTLALLVLRVGLLVKFRPSRAEVLTVVPLLIACAVMAFYALSNQVTLAGAPVADFTKFYEKLAPWPSIFRSSGRFVWPLFALLTMTAVLTAARLSKPVRTLVLGAAVLLQVADFDPARSGVNRDYPVFTTFQDPAWQLLSQGYRHVVIQPVQLQWVCPFNPQLVSRLSWEAARQHLSINSGHVGRAPPGTDCTRHLRPSELKDDTVYLPYFPEFLADFTAAGFVCGEVEAFTLCVSPRRETPLSLELHRRAGAG